MVWRHSAATIASMRCTVRAARARVDSWSFRAACEIHSRKVSPGEFCLFLASLPYVTAMLVVITPIYVAVALILYCSSTIIRKKWTPEIFPKQRPQRRLQVNTDDTA